MADEYGSWFSAPSVTGNFGGSPSFSSSFDFSPITNALSGWANWRFQPNPISSWNITQPAPQNVMDYMSEGGPWGTGGFGGILRPYASAGTTLLNRTWNEVPRGRWLLDWLHKYPDEIPVAVTDLGDKTGGLYTQPSFLYPENAMYPAGRIDVSPRLTTRDAQSVFLHEGGHAYDSLRYGVMPQGNPHYSEAIEYLKKNMPEVFDTPAYQHPDTLNREAFTRQLVDRIYGKPVVGGTWNVKSILQNRPDWSYLSPLRKALGAWYGIGDPRKGPWR